MTDLPVTLIQKWLNAKAAFVEAQSLERELRAQLTAALFPNPVKGTQRYPLKAGHNIKLVQGFDYKLGNKDAISDGRKVPIAEQVEELQRSIEAVGNEGPLMAERLIKWVPELVVPEYEKLNTNYNSDKTIKELIDTILTVKPTSPHLTFEDPKSNGK